MEQLHLIDTPPAPVTTAWHLDDTTKETVRRGVAACRQALADAAARQADRRAA